jgi:hypothetical protein
VPDVLPRVRQNVRVAGVSVIPSGVRCESQEVVVEREVLAVVRDPAGDVLAVCNAGQSWSPRGAQAVIEDIRSGQHNELQQATF